MLHRNLPLKAASLLLAIFLWFWVMLNEENPITHATVEVEVQVRGVPAGLALDLKTRNVKVSLRGLEQDMTDLKSGVRASVSCKGLDAGTHRLPVNVQAPQDVAAVAVKPPAVLAVLEEVVSQSKTVEVELVGEPAGGFEIKSAECSPKQIQVSGARSRVERAAHIVAAADMARMAPGVPMLVRVSALDESGQAVDGVGLTPARVSVTAVSESVAVTKTLPIVPRTRGSLPSGLRLVSIEVEPAVATLLLPASHFASVTYVDTEQLDLGTVRRSTSRVVGLAVPAGASLVDDTPVRVVLEVESGPPRPPQPQPPEPEEEPAGQSP
jgi:YbbR domain-containing protein